MYPLPNLSVEQKHIMDEIGTGMRLVFELETRQSLLIEGLGIYGEDRGTYKVDFAEAVDLLTKGILSKIPHNTIQQKMGCVECGYDDTKYIWFCAIQ